MLRRDFLRLLAAAGAGRLASAVPAVAAADNAEAPAVDMHSHAWRRKEFAADLREGGINLAVFVVTSDRLVMSRESGRLRAVGEALPGQLRAHSLEQAEQISAAARRAGFQMVLSPAEVSTTGTGILLGYEGGDVLEGALEHLHEIHAGGARLFQPAHYRVNELSDIQTEDPVHGGLTPLGRHVVRECNRLGIIVDVAHATLAATRHALEESTRPLVLSHTFLTRNPRRYTRGITLEHARRVAESGGVIGVVPFPSSFPTLDDYVIGIARTVEAVGVDHVGIGTDMSGIRGTPPLGRYRQFPGLREKLGETGFGRDEVAKLMGGNFLRVFVAVSRPPPG